MDRNGVASSDVENPPAPTVKTDGSVTGRSKSQLKDRTRRTNAPTDRGKCCNPLRQYLPKWNTIFVISCVFAVSLDPLFFYILIIDQHKKCLQIDETLRNTAVVLRSLTDIFFLVHFIYEIRDAVKSQMRKNKKLRTGVQSFNFETTGGNSGPKSKKIRDRLIGVARRVAQKMSWLSFSIVIDFLALLPIPQLVIVHTFYTMKDAGYVQHSKVPNVFLLGQYVPRIFRIHLSSKELNRTTGIWVKGLINFFLYILASDVLGAFWYFFSLQRETSCWYNACVNYNTDSTGCKNTFYCDGQTPTARNITFLNEHCSLDTPDGSSSPFNFGIFLDSLKYQNTERIKFEKKFLYSFWWGLRNLSNFGTNLTTSTYVGENLFAILISVIGLLLFLYLIGNVQTFMQMETTKSEEMRRKIRMKTLDVNNWISRKEVPPALKKEIKISIKEKLKEHKDDDLHKDLFSILPGKTRKSLKRCLCMKTLQKIPMLETMSTKVLEMMCDYMKPVVYDENSFPFRMGDPLDRILFIIEGTLWTYSTSVTDQDTSPSTLMAAKSLQKGQIYGEELLDLASATFTQLLTSREHVKSQTKVEALVLMASDLATVVSRCQLHWNKCNKSQEAKEDMARSSIKAALLLLRFGNKQRHPRPATEAAGTTTATGENSPTTSINFICRNVN